MNKILNIGVDIGSTTVKMVVMDNKNNIFFRKCRHSADHNGSTQYIFIHFYSLRLSHISVSVYSRRMVLLVFFVTLAPKLFTVAMYG